MNKIYLIVIAMLLSVGCGSDNSGKKRIKLPEVKWIDLNIADTLKPNEAKTFHYRFVSDGWEDLIIKSVKNLGTGCSSSWPQEGIHILDTSAIEIACSFSTPGMNKRAFVVYHNGSDSSTALTMHIFIKEDSTAI